MEKIIGIGDVVVIGDTRFTVKQITKYGVTLVAPGKPMQVLGLDTFTKRLIEEN